MTAHRVPADAAGERLDRFLGGVLGSRTRAQRLIEAGHVRVEGAPTAKGQVLRGGELVEVEEPSAAAPADGPPVEFGVVYEDDALLVVDKPAGVVVHPGAGVTRPTLAQSLAGRAAGGPDPERAGIVHRLDRDTSGLLLVARSEEAHTALSRALRRREIRREYLALVEGTPPARSGTIDAPLGRDRQRRTRMSTDTDTPRAAVTHFELVETLGDFALLRVRLETGRTHQIRAHLLAIGHPVAGDPEYGHAGRLGLRRQFLHAERLALAHPLTGAPLDFHSPLPADLEAARVAAGRPVQAAPPRSVHEPGHRR